MPGLSIFRLRLFWQRLQPELATEPLPATVYYASQFALKTMVDYVCRQYLLGGSASSAMLRLKDSFNRGLGRMSSFSSFFSKISSTP